MAGHNKTRRKTDRKSNDPRHNFRGYIYVAVNMYILFMGNIMKGNKVYKDVKHCIRPTTGQVAKSLNWNYPGKRFMEKVDYPNYYMSDLP